MRRKAEAVATERRARAAVGFLAQARALGFVGELAAGGVDVFAATAAEAGVDAVFFQMGHELVDGGLVRFLEEGLVDGVVFDYIDEVGGHLAVNLDELFGVFGAIVKTLEEDIFKRNLVLR